MQERTAKTMPRKTSSPYDALAGKSAIVAGSTSGIEQIAALALFLAIEAGGSITGTALPIEGGWTAQ